MKKAPWAKLADFRLPAKTACSRALSPENSEKPELYCQDVSRAVFLVRDLSASGPGLIMWIQTNPLRLKLRGAFLFCRSILLKPSLMGKRNQRKTSVFFFPKVFLGTAF